MIVSEGVGYQNVESREPGEKYYMGGTFQKVDGSAVTLGDFGVNDVFVPMTDVITPLNEYGGAVASFIYMDKATVDVLNGYGYEFVVGWYDQDEYDNWDEEETLPNYNGYELVDGQALMVVVSDEGGALVFSGAVAMQNIELFCIGGGKQFLCNCTPVDRTLGEIEINADFVPMTDVLTPLNKFGGAAATYIYMDKATVDVLNGYGYEFVVGWYDQDEYDNWDEEETLPNYNSMPVPAGFGFMVVGSEDESGLIIPAAIEKK